MSEKCETSQETSTTNDRDHCAASETCCCGAGKDAGAAEEDAKTLQTRLEEAEARLRELTDAAAQAAEFKEEAARAKADFYNYRTRIERDRARDRVLAAESTVDALLPVLDNLDRTLEAVTDKDSPLCKGVAMVQRQFLSALQSLGLQVIAADGDFDPAQHEALMTVDVDDAAQDGKIQEVLHKGYKLGEKVLRAAQVKVGKKQ